MHRDQNKFRRRDPSEFRKRVEAYKNGTPIDEIYDGGYIKEPVITSGSQHKNGNLPGYTLGKNPTNATMYDDGTFIDDYTKVFDNLVATGTDKRPLYLRYDAPNSTYDPNAIRNFTDLAPVVGDIGQGLDAYNAFKNKDYTLAGILGTMLLLPNIIEKPIKHISKPMFRFINRFADIGDDAIDASILTGGMLGGIGAGFAIGDTGEEKLKYGYLGGVLGSIPGFGRYVLRDLQRSNKYIPYNIRKIIDPILDPVEYTKAHIGGYYGKYPTLELLRDEIQRLYRLWGIDADPNDLLTKTNILTEPEYILKHGSSSTGVQLRGLGGGIDLLGNKRNSLLPPKNTMQGSSTKNPLLGTYAHEVNHAIHDTFITKPYTLSTPGRFHDPLSGLMSEYYYIPNELYIHPNVTSNFKQIIGENWKKWKWLGSPEEFESELQNYLSMHNINYSLITKHQKSDLLRKISKRFDIKPSNETTLSNLLDYLGNDSDIYPNTRITYAYKDGKIAIKPSKRGTFTAAAKKHGASVREFESRVLKNPEKYSTAMVKKARFSRNARSWKH